jgi:hypothetical protein
VRLLFAALAASPFHPFLFVILGYVFPALTLDLGSSSGLWLASVVCSRHSLWVCGEPEVNSKD